MTIDDVRVSIEAGELALDEILSMIVGVVRSQRLTDVAVRSAEIAADLAEEVKLAASSRTVAL